TRGNALPLWQVGGRIDDSCPVVEGARGRNSNSYDLGKGSASLVKCLLYRCIHEWNDPLRRRLFPTEQTHPREQRRPTHNCCTNVCPTQVYTYDQWEIRCGEFGHV